MKYQIEKRANSVSLNDGERSRINPIVEDIQKKENVEFTNVKDIFLFLIDRYAIEIVAAAEKITKEDTEIDPEIKKALEFDLPASTEEITEETEEHDELDEQFENAIQELIKVTDSLEIPKGASISERLRLLISTAASIDSTVNIEENQMILTFTDAPKAPWHAKIKMLDAIAYNRKMKLSVDETKNDIINAILFQASTIHNHSRTFYTGF